MDVKIPDFIRSLDSNSFGHFTIENRFPEIIKSILPEYAGTKYESKLKELLAEFRHMKISRIESDHSYFENFNLSIAQHVGKTLWEAPFLSSEFFFYNKLLEITDYVNNRIDFFQASKKETLEKAVESLSQAHLNYSGHINADLERAIYYSLFGNIADLSLFSLNSILKKRESPHFDSGNIILNDIYLCSEFIQSFKNNIHIFLDNAGYELTSDLLLVDILLKCPCDKIVLHPKPVPMFVSDALESDITATLIQLKQAKSLPFLELSERVETAIKSKRIVIANHYFWSCNYFFDSYWVTELGISKTDLIISKGDLNYRRFFEDREWPYDIDTIEAISIKGFNVLFVRTLKSELITGVSAKKIEYLNNNDRKWLINGKYGIIQAILN